MHQERRHDCPAESAVASRRQVGELSDVSPSTSRGWVERSQIDARARPGVTCEASAGLQLLRKENAELKRANEILKTTSLFAAVEFDRRLR
jgi:transposase